MALKKIPKQMKAAINKIMVSMMMCLLTGDAKRMPF